MWTSRRLIYLKLILAACTNDIWYKFTELWWKTLQLNLNEMYSLSAGTAWTHCHTAVNGIQVRPWHGNDAWTNNWLNTPSIATSYTDNNAVQFTELQLIKKFVSCHMNTLKNWIFQMCGSHLKITYPFWKTGENYYFLFSGPQHKSQEVAMK